MVRLGVVLTAATVLGFSAVSFGAPVGVGLNGLAGHVELTSPEPEVAPVLRAGATADYARADGTLYAGDGSRQWRRGLSLAVAPLGWLSFGAQWRDLDTLNRLAEPGAVRARGDALYSLKVSRRWDDWTAGLLAQARAYVGEGTPAPAVFVLGGRAVGAIDFSLQAGWMVERPVVLRPSLTAIEAYAWQKPSYNAAALRLAASYAGEGWRPFVELSQDSYVGAGRTFGEQPKRLAAGAHLDTGIRGLTATPRGIVGSAARAPRQYPAEPPWRAGLTLAYALDLAPVWAVLFPEPGRFTGVVTDAAHGYPLEKAVVAFGGREFAVGRDGTFQFEGRGGVYAVRIEAPDYLPVTASVTVTAGQLRVERFGLRRNAGTVRGRVFLGNTSTPGAATLSLISPALVFESDAKTGLFSFELPPDAYAFEVSAPGFLPEKRSFALRLGKEVVFDQLVLRPAPKPRPMAAEPAKVVGEPATAATQAPAPPQPAPPAAAPEPPPVVARIPVPTPPAIPEPPKPPKVAPEVEREQERERTTWPPQGQPLPERLESPVFFEFGSWRIDPRSNESLDRLAAMLKNDRTIARVVIEGRADVIGTEAANRYVAGKRADAIFEALLARGVSPAKLTTTSTVYTRKAVGQSDVQRAQDRRVGFRIERD